MSAMATWCSAIPADDRTAIAVGLRRRDPELLDALIAKYEYRLFRYLVCITANRAAAEDLFQETWMRVLDRGDQYREGASFEAWLFSIARHLAIDLQRRRKCETLDAVDDVSATATDDSPLEAIFRHEQQ